MGALSNDRAVLANRFGVPNVHPRAQLGLTRFAVVARALWPDKTAAELAVRANVAVRTAKHWLKGDRTPSPVAIAVVVEEITREFR